MADPESNSKLEELKEEIMKEFSTLVDEKPNAAATAYMDSTLILSVFHTLEVIIANNINDKKHHNKSHVKRETEMREGIETILARDDVKNLIAVLKRDSSILLSFLMQKKNKMEAEGKIYYKEEENEKGEKHSIPYIYE